MPFIGSRPVDTTSRGWLVFVPAGGAALLALLVYLNTLDNPFVYDDFRLIVENPSILNLWNLKFVIGQDMTRPIVNISYAVDTMIWGGTPFGYHLSNLLLHAINVVLLFCVAMLAAEDQRRQTAASNPAATSPTVIAFAAAALFAVHPMLTEAVGYVSGRSEVAYSTFFLLAFLAGRTWMHEGGIRWWMACTGMWTLGVLTKESAVMLPVVLLVYDWFVLASGPSERRHRFTRLVLPMLAIALAAGLVRLAVLQLVEYPDQSGANPLYALVALEVVWRYLAIFVAPQGQSIFHAIPPIESVIAPRAIGSLLALVAFLALAWGLRRRHSVVSFGLLWFVLLLVPSAMLFTLGRGEAMAEHRAYLPAAGLFLAWGYAFGMLWARAGQHRMMAGAAAAMFLVSLAYLTFMRNAIWQDPVALTREAVRLAPGHWMPRILVGEAFRQSGQCGEAVAEYRAAISFRPQEEFPYTRLAGCLIEGRRLDEAEDVLRKLRAVNPASQDASMGLGVFALLAGRIDQSRAYFDETVSRDPAHPRAAALLAFLDGALPANETERVCAELRTVAGNELMVGACQNNREQHDGEPVSGPR